MMRPLLTSSIRCGLGSALVAVFLVLFTVETSQADLIFLKDGTVLQGIIKQESKLEVDTFSKEPFVIPTGHKWIDDGPRRIYFSQHNVGRVEKKVAPNEERILYRHRDIIVNPLPVSSLDAIFDAPDFDDKWRRPITARIGGRDVKIGQALSIMTPYWSRIDATEAFQLGGAYLTRELGLEQVRRLVGVHPDFVEKPGMSETDRAARRFRYVDFFTQTGWYFEAEAELQRIREDLPSQKAKAEAGLNVLNGFIARDRFEEIKRLHLAGIYELARNRAANFPLDQADARIQGEVTDFQGDCKKTLERINETRKLLGDLITELRSPETALFTEAATTIVGEIHPGNIGRLETFQGQARQWFRLKTQNQKRDESPEQILSLGITGWLLGSAAAENRVDSAVKLWKARALVLEVIKAPTPLARQQLVSNYLGQPQRDQISLDWFVQMIPYLPPAAPQEQITTEPIALSAAGTNYLVQLPTEYRHSFSYPVLILAHNAGEKADGILKRWSEALDHGYILIAVQWEANNGYQYSPQEHEIVLGALRDVRRRFNVDSDRVFLHGLGQGANMVFDVGLSHPDQFAGLIPMSGTPDYFALKYWKNSLYLPMYVITGERLGEPGKKTKSLFDQLILNNYASLWIQYKGRGVEWFAGEVPLIFDWMRGKTRAFPMHQLGNDDGTKGPRGEFCCLRPSDSKFYWLSSDFVLPRHLTVAGLFNNSTPPATFYASVDSQRNMIIVRPSGLKQLTIWLGRNSKGQTTINFDKPVSVQVNTTIRINQQKVTPSLGVLLEDLALRGDRQQLFLARIDMNF